MNFPFRALTLQCGIHGQGILTITIVSYPLIQYAATAETAAFHRGRIRLLRPIIWNGECLRPGSTVTLPSTILATLTPGVDYEAASEPQADSI